jgi:hypothetical protein
MLKKRLLGWMAIVLTLLLVPFVAMQFSDEVQWSLGDFLVLGSLLFAIGLSYELIARAAHNKTYKIAFMMALLTAFLLFMANTAVGIIGSEHQEANLLYALVLLVGLVGSLISKFRAGGMAKTLFAVTGIQLMVPVIAIIVWPPSEISWSPSVLGVFLISAFFAFLFYLSGRLFKRSARQEKKLS